MKRIIFGIIATLSAITYNITLCCLMIVGAIYIFGEQAAFALFRDGALERAVRIVNADEGREVIFLPMSHLNSNEFYANLRQFIAKRHTEGFVTFNEGIAATPLHSDTTRYITMPEMIRTLSYHTVTAPTDIAARSTLLLKERKIVGTHITWEDSLRHHNKNISATYNSDAYRHAEYAEYGVMTEQDYWVDYTLADLVNRYERKYGEVMLTDYDFQTDLLDKYSRNGNDPDQRHYIKQAYTNWFREDYLRRKILDAPFKKIVVIYGAVHIDMVYLPMLEHGFVQDPEFSAL